MNFLFKKLSSTSDTFKKAFITSSLAHLTFILAILLFSFFTHFTYKKKVPVFTLQATSTHSNSQSQTSIKPQTSPLKQSTAIATTSSPSVQTQKISYNDFLKNHPLTKNPTKTNPQKTISKTVPSPKSTPSPPAIKSLAELSPLPSTQFPALSSQVATTPNKSNEFNNYILSVKNCIDLEWQKPNHTSGYTQETIVQFTINPNGILQNFRLIQRSGSKEFDASIEQAFSALPSLPLPPKGQTHTFELAFNLHQNR